MCVTPCRQPYPLPTTFQRLPVTDGGFALPTSSPRQTYPTKRRRSLGRNEMHLATDSGKDLIFVLDNDSRVGS